ncbi:DNA ligase 1-like [Neodiprion pinetum]|uniref:DNA ligase 1-like n=1 Tax=Neodiprion pinetum TaxID=441929 RepID=UPI0037234563
MFVWKDEDPGKEMPNPITKAALNYKATPRIIEMAVPHVHETESCRDLAISKKALKHKTTKREKTMSLAKKGRDCPNSLNEEEFARLFTPTGIKKSALTYKITEWVSTLALPSYRFLKDRRDQEAQKMKKMIEASDDRGKKVLEEQRKQEEEKERKKKEKGKKGMKKKESKKGEKANGEKVTEKKPDEEDQEKEKKEEKQKKEEERKSKERKKWRTEPGPCKDNYGSVSKAALNAKGLNGEIQLLVGTD